MFPSFDFEKAIEEVKKEYEQESKIELGRVFKMKFEGRKAITVIENGKPAECKTVKEKVQMYVQMLLRTKIDTYAVYEGTGFGMSYFNYLGIRDLPHGFLDSELKREISEKIMKLKVVDSVINFKAKLVNHTLHITFIIVLANGERLEMSEVI